MVNMEKRDGIQWQIIKNGSFDVRISYAAPLKKQVNEARLIFHEELNERKSFKKIPFLFFVGQEMNVEHSDNPQRDLSVGASV